jgi:hypothetical protein
LRLATHENSWFLFFSEERARIVCLIFRFCAAQQNCQCHRRKVFYSGPVERQVERVAEIKAAGRVNDLPPVKEWEDVEHEQRRSLLNAWNRASPNVRAWFRENVVDQPIMDGRFGDAA